jgi:hypothetical protein
MKRLLVLSCLCLLVACGGNGSPVGNGQPDGSIPDGGVDGGAVSACLDVTNDLHRVPTNGLPCELVPPK